MALRVFICGAKTSRETRRWWHYISVVVFYFVKRISLTKIQGCAHVTHTRIFTITCTRQALLIRCQSGRKRNKSFWIWIQKKFSFCPSWANAFEKENAKYITQALKKSTLMGFSFYFFNSTTVTKAWNFVTDIYAGTNACSQDWYSKIKVFFKAVDRNLIRFHWD